MCESVDRRPLAVPAALDDDGGVGAASERLELLAEAALVLDLAAVLAHVLQRRPVRHVRRSEGGAGAVRRLAVVARRVDQTRILLKDRVLKHV